MVRRRTSLAVLAAVSAVGALAPAAQARSSARVDPFIRQAVLTAAGGAENDQLGRRVAVSGDTIVVGAPLHKVGANAYQGATYVFVKPAGGWADVTVPTAELTVRDGAAGDEFGSSVAVSGDTIVAGSTEPNSERGAAYVFMRPANGWVSTSTPTATLTVSNGFAGDALGTSLAASADTIVAGATRRVSALGRGTAYIFAKPQTGWASTNAPNAQLVPGDTAPNDGFGASLAVTNDTLVVGAPQRTVNAKPSQGAVYVYVRPASGWNGLPLPTAELTVGNGAAHDALGTAVAVSGGTVLAGAPGPALGSDLRPGTADMFMKPDSGWASTTTPAAALSVSGGAPGDGFGTSVAASDDTVVVGAPGRKVAGNPAEGAAYAFMKPSTGWTTTSAPDRALIATDGLPNELLGTSAALSGETVVLGAPGHATGINQYVGAAYVLAPPPEQCPPGEVGTAPFCETPLTITGVAQAHRVWRAGTRLATISRQRRPVATAFTFRLSTGARVVLSFARRTDGRVVRGRCVRRTSGNRRHARCTRTLSAGTLTFNARAGTNTVRFEGRLAPTKWLSPGTYVLTIEATNAGQRASAPPITFSIMG